MTLVCSVVSSIDRLGLPINLCISDEWVHIVSCVIAIGGFVACVLEGFSGGLGGHT